VGKYFYIFQKLKKKIEFELKHIVSYIIISDFRIYLNLAASPASLFEALGCPTVSTGKRDFI